MNTAQNANQPVVWYVDSRPNENVRSLFEIHGWKYSEFKRGPDLVSASESLKAQSAEIKRPDVVLLGDVNDLSENQRQLVQRLADCGIETFVPFAKSYTTNQTLLNWPQEEREQVGLRSIKIIGFGGKNREGRPLVLFQFGTEDAEKHFGALENAIRPSPTLTKQQNR